MSPINVPNKRFGYPGQPLRLLVPCGKCEACLESKRSSWFVRFKEEAKVSSSSVFVTLTYEDSHLPIDLNLDKKELQGYLKRLRSKLHYPIRYYGCGEYCPTSGRPHYHLVIWGMSKLQEDTLLSAWQGRGFITCRDVNDNRLRYLAGYVIGKEDYPEGRNRPFSLMSKGLGRNYLSQEIKDWHNEPGVSLDRVHYSGKPLPRYFKDRIYSERSRELFAKRLEARADHDWQDKVALYGSESNARRQAWYETMEYKRRSQNRKKNRSIFGSKVPEVFQDFDLPLICHQDVIPGQEFSPFNVQPNEEFDI